MGDRIGISVVISIQYVSQESHKDSVTIYMAGAQFLTISLTTTSWWQIICHRYFMKIETH